jgi:FCD domain.
LGQKATSVSPGELRDLAEHQAAIAGRSAWLAAQRASSRDLETLAELVSSYAGAEHPVARVRADSGILVGLATTAQSPRLTRAQLNLQTEWAPLTLMVHTGDTAVPRVLRSFSGLLDALGAADATIAREIVEGHIAAVATDILTAHVDTLRVQVAEG